MKVRYRNTDLPVTMLYPHPDNPRRDVGDVTELAESIKANGIFQNLTVVWGGKGVKAAHPNEDDPDGYTVIIGHRRLAAAKAAGLDVVPCMVVEMDDREQAATMLLENMQRSDLTVYEQAQGFQMMLDLGETQEGIAKKTGFSKTTIRHRLKLLELDPEEFAKAQERQATFSDYMELEKIKDPANKTEALKAIGTSNFKWKVEQIITRENAGENYNKAIDFLDGKFKKINFDRRFEYRQIGYLPVSKPLTDDRIKGINALIEKGAKYYTISSESPEFAWAYIYTETNIETEEEKAERCKREELNRKRRNHEEKIRALEAQAATLRITFVKEFANREKLSTLTEALISESNIDDVDLINVAELIGIELADNEGSDALTKKAAYREKVKKHPESIILAMLCTVYENDYVPTPLHDHEGRYMRNIGLENWYAILTRVGYKMSSDERKLLSGMHEIFKKLED